MTILRIKYLVCSGSRSSGCARVAALLAIELLTLIDFRWRVQFASCINAFTDGLNNWGVCFLKELLLFMTSTLIL